MHVLIVDDEPPARKRLRELLEQEQDVSKVSECGDGGTAVSLIELTAPDIVFLDVEMPELDGFGVVDAVGPENMPAVIFATAYDRYAIQAFDVAAVDYLLKPYDTARFRQALERGRAQMRADGPSSVKLSDLIARHVEAMGRPDRLAVKADSRIRLLPTAEIDYITAEGTHVRLHLGRESILMRRSITSLEQRLDNPRFARLHRSFIVNVEAVVELEPLHRGEFVLRLRSGARLITGRTFKRKTVELFGVE
jgi:two-component system, LytTR family, response regulator